MKTIGKRFWNEPSVAIGALVSLALLVLSIIRGDFDASSISGIIAPLLTSLGIRQFVTPAKEQDEQQRTTS